MVVRFLVRGAWSGVPGPRFLVVGFLAVKGAPEVPARTGRKTVDTPQPPSYGV
ncbi:hypothetical protein SGLAM104S_09958 [Streptomyces glaucescens]